MAGAEAAEAAGHPYDVIVLADTNAPAAMARVRQDLLDHDRLPYPRFVIARTAASAVDELDDIAEVTFVDADPLRRAGLVTSVAIAAGRASPEVRYDDEAELQEHPGRAPTVDEALAQGRLILLAEDNPTNQDVIRRQLNMLGYACEITDDGKAALAAWQDKSYALLLTDCHMPKMDGFELTAAVRSAEKEGAARAPIVAITANALEGEAERCLAAGMDDYLSKPVEMSRLRRALEKWMPAAPADTAPTDPPMAEPQPTGGDAGPGDGPINRAALTDMFGDDPEMFAEILGDFVTSATAIVAEIKAAHDARDGGDVGGGGHKLKSAARAVGAYELADMCERLEQAGKAADWPTIDHEAPHLDGALRAVADYVAAL